MNLFKKDLLEKPMMHAGFDGVQVMPDVHILLVCLYLLAVFQLASWIRGVHRVSRSAVDWKLLRTNEYTS